MEFIDSKYDYKTLIIGCDEVGTGAAVGKLCVCGVKADKSWKLDGLNDSKQLSSKKRYIMRDKLLKLAEDKTIEYYIAERSNDIIDELSLGVALKQAYVEIFNKLYCNDSLIIVDGQIKFDNINNFDMITLIKADCKIQHVMAASILAKTYRDDYMHEMHDNYPEYGWDKNVGYLSKKHIEAIKSCGLSPLHRKSYKIKGVE
jgi:ribonuclease HII